MRKIFLSTVLILIFCAPIMAIRSSSLEIENQGLSSVCGFVFPRDKGCGYFADIEARALKLPFYVGVNMGVGFLQKRSLNQTNFIGGFRVGVKCGFALFEWPKNFRIFLSGGVNVGAIGILDNVLPNFYYNGGIEIIKKVRTCESVSSLPLILGVGIGWYSVNFDSEASFLGLNFILGIDFSSGKTGIGYM